MVPIFHVNFILAFFWHSIINSLFNNDSFISDIIIINIYMGNIKIFIKIYFRFYNILFIH